MADYDTSRLWELMDDALLSYFEQTYPQPLPWTLCHLMPGMCSALISPLDRKRVDPQLFLNMPEIVTLPGISGKTFAWSTLLIHPSTLSKIQFTTSWSLPSTTMMGTLQKMVSPSDLGQWQKPYAPSARQCPVWGPKIIA